MKISHQFSPKFLEKLHNAHKREEIWVIGCGPSLDDFPQDFFDENKRIAIAATLSFFRSQKCRYYHWSQPEETAKAFFARNRRLLSRSIVNLLPNVTPEYPEAYYCLNHNHVVYWDYYKNLAPYLLAGKRPPLPPRPGFYGSTGTIIHVSIQIAIIMGAKKITAVGCEARYRRYQSHALKYGMDQGYGPTARFSESIPKEGFSDARVRGTRLGLRRMHAGTNWLAKIMKPHGVIISRYFYGKGYEPITSFEAEDWKGLT